MIEEGKRRNILWLLRTAFVELKKHDPLRMAGATAFFTTFALPPIMIILFRVFSLFLDKRFVGRELRSLISDTLGTDGAAQVLQTAKGFNTLASTWYIAAGGFLFLVFVATTLFSVIKNSINEIWNIDVKSRAGLLFGLKLRARSFAIIMVAGILFLAGVVLDSFELLAGNYLQSVWSHAGAYFKSALNEIVSVVIVTAWFIVLFRYVADGRPSWRVSMAGGCLTGILFSIGKEIISLLMRNSNLGSIYGASASIVLILLFVFYSSFILYYGASFIKVYARHRNDPHRLISQAYRYRLEAVVEDD